MKKNSMRVTIVLNSGETLNGEINMMDYSRFSDFIENHEEKHVKLYNTTRDHMITGSIAKFVLIPKGNISYYEPFDEKRNA
ncbi:MAG: hypothetical protein DRH34_05490 [Deltaproteobacteria bacterium]|nr:MAG: hypothetical protein DRH34_05490 [Deltaproteobacteria bacterium]RLC14029.1 MAG: hypothetical protein DRH93_21230 [Deltaproteobacteria bacterium]